MRGTTPRAGERFGKFTRQEKEAPTPEAPELALLRAQFDTCEVSELTDMLEALVVRHAVLAPEVRQLCSLWRRGRLMWPRRQGPR